MPNTITIIPCPFSAVDAPHTDVRIVEVDKGVHAVCCDTCGATGPIENYHNARQTPERATELWNARGWHPISTLPAVTGRTEILFKWQTHHDVLLLWPDGEITDRDEDPISRAEWPAQWRPV